MNQKAMNVIDVMDVLEQYQGRSIFVKEGYDDTTPICLACSIGYKNDDNEIILCVVDESYDVGPEKTDALYNMIKYYTEDKKNLDSITIKINGKNIIGYETFENHPMYLYFIVEKNELGGFIMNEKGMNLNTVLNILKAVSKRKKIFVKEGYDDTLPVELARMHGYSYMKNEIFLYTIGKNYSYGPVETGELYRHLRFEILSKSNINREAEVFIDDKKIIGTETFMNRPLYFYFIVEKNESKEEDN